MNDYLIKLIMIWVSHGLGFFEIKDRIEIAKREIKKGIVPNPNC